MADTERRAGYRGGFDWQTLQDRREEELTLQNVPGFQRPMAAGPMDRITGVDELTGSPVRQTAIGTEYTVRRNPDQRTARQKAEDWYNNGAQLPTLGQVGQAVASIPGAVYDSARASLEGTATLGEVMGFAPAMGAVGAMQTLPEGAIPIFGGRRARSFGQELALRRKLPTSVGADDKDRFEIDDSFAMVENARNLSVISNARAQLPQDHTVLSDVLKHDELFLQYPHLADLPVVLDMSLSTQGTYGYFWPQRGYLALNPRLLNKPEELRHTLFHEVQHAVQDFEGFDGGSNTKSPQVDQRMETQRRIAYQDFDEDVQEYNKSLLALSEVDWNSYFDRFEKAALDGLKGLGVDTSGYVRPDLRQGIQPLPLRRQVGSIEDFDTKHNSRRLVEILDIVAQAQASPDPTDRVSLMREAFDKLGMTAINTSGSTKETLSDHFRGFFTKDAMDPEDFIGMLDPAETLLEERLPFVLPEPPKWSNYAPTGETRDLIYRTNAGEVEAENAARRRDFSLSERERRTPEQTERYTRELQWRNSDDHSLIKPRAR